MPCDNEPRSCATKNNLLSGVAFARLFLVPNEILCYEKLLLKVMRMGTSEATFSSFPIMSVVLIRSKRESAPE